MDIDLQLRQYHQTGLTNRMKRRCSLKKVSRNITLHCLLLLLVIIVTSLYNVTLLLGDMKWPCLLMDYCDSPNAAISYQGSLFLLPQCFLQDSNYTRGKGCKNQQLLNIFDNSVNRPQMDRTARMARTCWRVGYACSSMDHSSQKVSYTFLEMVYWQSY